MISVIIPTLNEGERLNGLLEHLGTFAGIEEKIIVDASDQRESRMQLDKAQRYLGARVLRAQKRGRAAQMNQGAAEAKGRILVFLHCDTVLPEAADRRITAALQRYSWGRFDLRLDGRGVMYRLIGLMINLRSRVTRLATGDQTIFMKRRFFDEVGGFSDIALMEDIEFSKRVGKLFPPALITVPVTTSARRWASYGTFKTILLMWRLRFLYRIGVHPDKLAMMYRNAR